MSTVVFSSPWSVFAPNQTRPLLLQPTTRPQLLSTPATQLDAPKSKLYSNYPMTTLSCTTKATDQQPRQLRPAPWRPCFWSAAPPIATQNQEGRSTALLLVATPPACDSNAAVLLLLLQLRWTCYLLGMQFPWKSNLFNPPNLIKNVVAALGQQALMNLIQQRKFPVMVGF